MITTATAPAPAKVIPAETMEQILRRLVLEGSKRTFVNGRFYDVSVKEVPAERTR